MDSHIVKEILSIQKEDSYIKTYPNFYTAKYKGLVWQLIILAELAAEKNDQIKEQCEYILENSQEKSDGGFAMHRSAKMGGGRITEVIPCLTGNMIWTLIHFVYFEDIRVKKALQWLVKYMKFNDGKEENPQVYPYNRYEICWGKHTCHMGVVKVLKALSAIPKEMRTDEINGIIEEAVEFLLSHHIYKKSHDLSKTSKPGWLRLGFPLMYQTDILEIMDILTMLKVKDNRMDDALDIIISKQMENGRWKIENTYKENQFLVNMEKKSEDSKWLTLRALRVIKRY